MSKTIVKFSSLIYAVLLPALLCIPITATSQEPVTPSHLFQISEDIISEIEILREAIGVDEEASEPEGQRNKSAIQVYSKGLEVLEKIAKTQRKLGMNPAKVGEIPLKEINAADVHELVKIILLELQGIKKQLVITEEIKAAKLVGAKMYAHVYENMWLASYMLDGLIPPIKAKDVYRNIQYLQDELRLIATNLNVGDLQLEAKEVDERKRLKDIGQQALLALYKISDLENRLSGMTAASVPQVTLVRIRSSDIYDLTNMLLAEMVRIKVHLKISLQRGQHGLPGRVKPNDVFAQMKLVVDNLEKILKAVGARK